MFNSITYKFSRIFWSIYFVATIALIGFIFGYILSFSILLLSVLLVPGTRVSVKVRQFAEDFQCLSIRMLLRMQPWLRCQTNLPGIIGFYNRFSTRKILFVANHRSNLDTFLLISFIPGLRGLAKSTLFYNIFFAPFMLAAGFIPVDKGSPDSLLKGLKVVKTKVFAKNRAVLNFPENTRCDKGFTSVQKFSGAFFSLAKESQVLVVPLVIQSTDQILGRGDLFLNPYHPVQIKMLEPIEAAKFENFLELRDLVWSQIKAGMA
jgi:1-acyl-sn-glycerol-3-phosphate acyltransferase